MTIPALRRRKRRLLERIHVLSQQAGEIHRGALERERYRLIESPGVKIAAISEIRPISAMPYAGMEAAGRRFDLKQPYSGTVRWRYEPKRRAGRRIVCNLPLQLRVGQSLAHDLIVAQHVPRAHIGLWQGRGIGRHVRAISQALERGYPFAVVADVCSAFAGVNIDAVYNLGLLPSELIASCIDSRLLGFRQAVGDRRADECTVTGVTGPLRANECEQAGPAGLMEGGKASGSLFACLLDDIPDYLPRGVLPFTYGDDVTVVCRTEQDASAAADALGRYFVGHRAGPLFHRHFIANVNDGFDHLGYHFEVDRGRVTVGFTTSHLIGVTERAIDALSQLSATELHELDLDHFVRVKLSPYISLDQADRDAFQAEIEMYVVARAASLNALSFVTPEFGLEVAPAAYDRQPWDD